MEKSTPKHTTFCNQIFGNLYNNKIILLKGTYFFCEFQKCLFANGTLSVELKVLEPVVKLKPRYKNLYEKLKNETNTVLHYSFANNKYFGIEEQQISGIYTSPIWANYSFVEKVYALKEQGLEQEIYEMLQ